MGVGSFPELFLQYFAWGMYNVLWDVMVSLGLVYIPFGYYLFDAYTSSREKSSNKMTSRRVLAYLEMKLFIGVVVLTLAGVPALSLDLKEMKFNERQCNIGSLTPTMSQKKPDATGTGTGTTYDTTFTTTNMGSLTAKAPIAWMAILAVGQAVNDGVGVKVPCTTSLKEAAHKLQLEGIKNPQLKQEVTDFYNGCYKQAVAKFDAEHPASYNVAAKKYVESNDAAWLGSKFYLSEPDYYNKMQPPSAVPGFIPFVGDSVERDKGVWNGTGVKPSWSKPYCKEWYEHSTKGIRAKIIANTDTTLWTDTKSFLAGLTWFGGSATDAEDVIIRTLVDVSDIKTMRPSYKKSDMSSGSQSFSNNGVGNIDSIHDAAAGAAAVLGTYEFNQTFYPMMIVLKMALPLVQAFVIAGLIMFLPFLLILSNYGVKETLAMGALLLSIKFWPVIWLVGNWMENTLENAILPTDAATMAVPFLPVIKEGLSLNDDVLDYVIGSWYLLGPALLTVVMTISGYQGGAAIQGGLASAGGSGSGAGKSGGKMTGKMTGGGKKSFAEGYSGK